MRKFVILAFLFSFAIPVRAGQSAPLRLIQTIPMPGVRGRIDHMDVDLQHRRLFMSALGNDTLEVIDLRTNKLIRALHGLHEPQGVTFVPRSNRIFVANGGDGIVRVFDGDTYKLLKSVRFPSDADDTRYDAATNEVIVAYGDRGDAGLAFLNGSTGNLLGTIRLPSHPESFQLEKSGNKIFVNIPTAGNIIDVVSRAERKVIATWMLAGAAANFPMALDEKDHRLFIACRRPPEMLVLDTQSGKIIARVPCVGVADDMWYDSTHKRIYITGGEGFISVINQIGVNHYGESARIRTAPGGRTSIFVPELNRLYLAIERHGDQPAELRIYQIER